MRISDWSSDVCSSDLRDSVTTVAKLNRGAQHDFLFAFGEDDALGIVARGFIGERENRRGRVEPRAQPGAIFAQILDRDRKSTRLNSSHSCASRMPSSA